MRQDQSAASQAERRPNSTARLPLDEQSIEGNIKVNQGGLNEADPDLHGRGQTQNEAWIAVNPGNPDQLVASYHDYRRGDAACGVSHSSDGGRNWTDSVIPDQFVRGGAFGGRPRQYFQAGGDPNVAWDSRGNVYYACGEFNRGPGLTPSADESTGLYVFRSTGTGGATWSTPGRPVVEENSLSGQGPSQADKQLITVDQNPASPFRDRVYVTWTSLAKDGTAYIFASHSADYGRTFSAPVLVSGDAPVCMFQYGAPTPLGRCNVNQGSEPVVGPDGSLYVVYDNYNTPVDRTDNKYQILLSKSTDGGATFSAPTKVGDFYDLPDCLIYQGQNTDNSCVPEKGSSRNSIFRAANYAMAAVHPRDPRRVVVTYGSYINRNSNERNGCVPDGFAQPDSTRFTYGLRYHGVKDGTCNNDIVLATSTDGGRTFDGTTIDVRALPVVTDQPAQATTDQFFHGTVFSPRGTLVTTYYDRQYGSDEATGYSDITLTTISDRGSRSVRVTTSSMPPPTELTPPYYGDYIMVAATATLAHPVWSDTRRPALFPCAGPGGLPARCTGPPPGLQTLDTANDQDIATAVVSIE